MPPSPEVVEPTNLIIGDSAEPLVDITVLKYPLSELEKYENIELNDDLKNKFAGLMRHAPNLVKNVSDMASVQYLVKFSPEVMEGFSNGNTKLMKTLEDPLLKAVAVDSSTNQIVELGCVEKMSGLNVATAGLAIWGLTAAVTGQKFLSDINRKLGNIERGLEDIKNYLDDVTLGKIYGNYNYLREVAGHISGRAFTERDCNIFYNQIESISRESSQIIETINMQIMRKFRKIQNQKLKGIGLKKHSEDMKKNINDFENCVYSYDAVLSVKNAAGRIKCALPVNRKIAEDRIKGLEYIAQKHKNDLYVFETKIKANIPNLQGFFSASETNEEFQQELLNDLKKMFGKLHNKIDETLDSLIKTKKILEEKVNESKESLQLIVTLKNDGTIDGVNKIK